MEERDDDFWDLTGPAAPPPVPRKDLPAEPLPALDFGVAEDRSRAYVREEATIGKKVRCPFLRSCATTETDARAWRNTRPANVRESVSNASCIAFILGSGADLCATPSQGPRAVTTHGVVQCSPTGLKIDVSTSGSIQDIGARFEERIRMRHTRGIPRRFYTSGETSISSTFSNARWPRTGWDEPSAVAAPPPPWQQGADPRGLQPSPQAGRPRATHGTTEV